MKTKIETTLTLLIIVALAIWCMTIFESHKDTQRAEYAERNNCTWTIQGSHNVCK